MASSVLLRLPPSPPSSMGMLARMGHADPLAAPSASASAASASASAASAALLLLRRLSSCSCSTRAARSEEARGAARGESSVLDVRHPVMILQEWAQHQGEGSFPAAFEMVDRVRRPAAGAPGAGKQWWTTLTHRRSGVSATGGPFAKKKLSRLRGHGRILAH